MGIKRGLCFLIFLAALTSCSVVMAQSYQLDISTDKQSYIPGENVSFRVLIRDAEGNMIDDNVYIKIKDANKKTRIEKEVEANKFDKFPLEKDALRGWWSISASFKGNSVDPRFFNVEANEEAEFQMRKGILIIKNIGNVPYAKPIQIIIGTKTEIIEPYLEIKEETSYRLVAPDGIYNVKVTDGEKTIIANDVQLTGKAISITPIEIPTSSPITGMREYYEEDISILAKYKLAWAFIALIFGLFILMIIQNAVRGRKIKKK